MVYILLTIEFMLSLTEITLLYINTSAITKMLEISRLTSEINKHIEVNVLKVHLLSQHDNLISGILNKKSEGFNKMVCDVIFRERK